MRDVRKDFSHKTSRMIVDAPSQGVEVANGRFVRNGAVARTGDSCSRDRDDTADSLEHLFLGTPNYADQECVCRGREMTKRQ